MIDPPAAEALIGSVARYLRQSQDTAAGTRRFEDKVAVNALEIAQRELDMRERILCDEQARLTWILDQSGDLRELNEILCERILTGAIDPGAQPVRDHLWATAMAKVSVDQPSYASYRAELDEEERQNS